MLQRSVIQLASRSALHRVPIETTTQIPSYLCSRRAFSVSQKNGLPNPGLGSSTPEHQSQLPKIAIGGFALGSVFLAAYHYGFLDQYLHQERQSINEHTKAQFDDNKTEKFLEQPNTQARELNKSIAGNSSMKSDVFISNANHSIKDESVSGDSIRTDVEKNYQSADTSVLTPENFNKGKDVPTVPHVNLPSENIDFVDRKDVPTIPQIGLLSDDIGSKPDDKSFDAKALGSKPAEERNKATDITPTVIHAIETPSEIDTTPVKREHITAQDTKEVVLGDGAQMYTSLLDEYYLKDNLERTTPLNSNKLKDISSMMENPYDGIITKDGKLVLDFLQAIHTAEERQAELDARSFNEEKRAIKEKYEKELKDAKVRELMYAEREAILEKELNKERAKAAVALKSLQDKLEVKLKTELEQKEMEVEQKLKKMQDIAQAELAAAIASEKASRIEQMAEANLHINALCMAFYARSEEARQNHSVHKLALGALSLEDALSKGLPIKNEIDVLHNHIEGIDNDSLISLVLSSLPEDTQQYGTDTLSQLNHKFDALKGTLRHFSLIPSGGGGILTHSLAYVASWLKVREVDESGDGIESLITRVDNLLAQGKLCEAADTLENGVKGSKAAEVVNQWVWQARNRAITEQALTVLQSYATSISLT